MGDMKDTSPARSDEGDKKPRKTKAGKQKDAEDKSNSEPRLKNVENI